MYFKYLKICRVVFSAERFILPLHPRKLILVANINDLVKSRLAFLWQLAITIAAELCKRKTDL